MSTEPDITEGASIDPSLYIRTYAKDFAALSGGSQPVSSEAPKSERPKKQEKPPKVKKERKPHKTKAPPSKQPAETTELPRIAPGDIVPQAPSPVSRTPDDSAEILARLKAHALENKDREARADVPPTVPQPLPISQASLIPTRESGSPLHTFTSDFQDQIKEEHASQFSVLAAQKDAPIRKQAPQKKSHAGILMTTAAIILILAGGGLVFIAYSYVHKNQPVATISFAPSLIAPDSRVLLSGNGEKLLAALGQQAAEPLPDGNVELTYVNESTTTAQGVLEEPASGGAFITELNLQAPDILLRNIDPSSMVGIVSEGGETRPFFILRVTSYERTFAGMLEWEPTLFRELAVLYPEYPAAVIPVVPISTPIQTSTSTASSTKSTSTTTPAISAPQPIAPPSNQNLPLAQFADETIDSHDVRVLKDNSGRTLVLYGYADKQTLIIARNEAAFTLLLNRLSSSSD